jgi:DNA-binding transcriptional LysR family regulator
MKTTKRLTGKQINWNQVFYFSEVAAAGSLKEASSKLGLSSSTLSEHIAQLEKDLEVQLFLRHHRKMTLTPEGNRLFLRAKEMFEAGQRLIDVVSPIPLGSYPVSVGLVPGPSLQLAYAIIGQFTRDFCPVDMKLIHSTQMEFEAGLAKSDFDFGFTDQKPTRKDITSHSISHSNLRFYVSNKHHRESSFGELLSQIPLLVCSAEPNIRSLAEQAIIDADLTPCAVIASDYPSSLLELCEQGLGIGVFSEASMSDRPGFRALRGPKDVPKLQSSLFVLWSNDAENTEAIRHLRQVLRLTGNHLGVA